MFKRKSTRKAKLRNEGKQTRKHLKCRKITDFKLSTKEAFTKIIKPRTYPKYIGEKINLSMHTNN